ncbi:hypothetical protein NECID01_2013 [Nematocida sp. AWRm77]|nr:hypothetical protein NECID01_2013 [Nematocida sp. AWRm77]
MDAIEGESTKKNYFYYTEDKYTHQITEIAAYYVELLQKEKRDLFGYLQMVQKLLSEEDSAESSARIGEKLDKIDAAIKHMAGKKKEVPVSMFKEMKSIRPMQAQTEVLLKGYSAVVEEIYCKEKAKLASSVNLILGDVLCLLNQEGAKHSLESLHGPLSTLLQKTLDRITSAQNVEAVIKQKPGLHAFYINQNVSMEVEESVAPPSWAKTVCLHGVLVSLFASLCYLATLYGAMHMRVFLERVTLGRISTASLLSKWTSFITVVPLLASITQGVLMGTLLCNRNMYLKGSVFLSLATTLAECAILAISLAFFYFLLRGWVQNLSSSRIGSTCALGVYAGLIFLMWGAQSVYAKSREGIRQSAYYLVTAGIYLCFVSICILAILSISSLWCIIRTFVLRKDNGMFAEVGSLFSSFSRALF